MVKKHSRKPSNLVTIVVFIMVGCAPLLWNNGYGENWLLGYGDYISPFDSKAELLRHLSSYDLLPYGGADHTFNQSFILYYLIHLILERLLGSPALATTCILCLLIFFTQYGIFSYINEKLGHPRDAKIISIVTSVSIMYGTSPYFVSNAYPGHISSLFLLAIFPFLIRHLDDYLDADSCAISFQTGLKLICCVLLGAPAFANIGNYVAMLLVFGVYILLRVVFSKINPLRLVARFSLFLVAITALNLWWMLGFAVDIGDSIQRNQAGNMIGAGLDYATRYASIWNILNGLPETIFYSPDLLETRLYSSWIYRTLVCFLWIVLLFGFIIRSDETIIRYNFALLGLLLFSSFITKGPNPPFGDLFMFAWENVPTFQIFRRPGSKIYWAYWFSFLTLSAVSAYLLTGYFERHKLRGLNIFLVILFAFSAAFSFIALSTTTLLKGVSPPKAYVSAAKFLEADGVTRVLMFPNRATDPFTMNQNFNDYHGVDFFEKMVGVSVLAQRGDPHGELKSLQDGVNLLAQRLTSEQKLCRLFRDLAISHVLFSSDLIMSDPTKENYLKSLRSAHSSKELRFISKFDSLVIFRVTDACLESPVSYVYADGIDLRMVSVPQRDPAMFSFGLSSGVKEVHLIMRSDFSRNWVVDLHPNNTSFFENMIRRARIVKEYIFSSPQPEAEGMSVQHSRYAGFGNQWAITVPTTEAEQSVTVVYIKQYFFIIGVMLSAMFVIFLLSFDRLRREINAYKLRLLCPIRRLKRE